MEDDNPLARVLAALKAKLDARVDAATLSAEKLHAAVDAYVRAVKAGVAAEVARQHGLDAPEVESTPEDAASALLALVHDLPELGDVEAPKPPAVDEEAAQDEPGTPAEEPVNGSGAEMSFSEMLASEPEHPRPEPPLPRETADPEVLDLVHDLRSYDMMELPMPLFRAVAEELAARGRELQDRHASDPDDKLTLVFRALTSCAYKRGVKNIFGLNRAHEADWTAKAASARERRLRLQTGEPDTLQHRLQLPKAVVEQVAAANGDDQDEDDAGPEEWDLPRLAARASTGAVAMIGGVVKKEKLDRIHHHLGFDVEWIETGTNGMGSTTALERRIREGHIAAVVVLEGLIGHKHYEQIVDAARQAGVPLAYGGTAGIGKLKGAFTQIETMLA